jgi:threonine dehydratase
MFSNISKHIIKTPLQFNQRLSDKFMANIYLKREDLQITRSFKLRGSLNAILNQKSDNIVCASAGNHAQGFAYSCNLLGKKGTIFLPITTPQQKIQRIKYFGKDSIKLKIIGNNFTQTLDYALEYSYKNNNTFIHPYDDKNIIQGQGSIYDEIIKEIKPDYISCCVGGGGLISGIIQKSNLNKKLNTKIIGGEPLGADSMHQALLNGKPVEIENLDTFVDGASVKKVGNLTFDIVSKNLNINDIKVIPKGKICNEMINLYQEDGIIVEPAGVLSVCALDYLSKDELFNKNVICILSGGNNDILRYPEIMEINQKYLGIKHYYIIEFTQKPKELKRFITNILGEKDDITRFEYIKKTNKSFGNVLVGLETKNHLLIEEGLKKNNFNFVKIQENDLIYSYLI